MLPIEVPCLRYVSESNMLAALSLGAAGVGLLGCLEGLGSKNSSGEARLKIDTEFGQMMDEACEKRGLLVRPIINMCVFSPPLIITQSEIDDMFDILEDAIVEVQQNYS